VKIVHDLDEWGQVARELGPGSNWHEPDNYGLTGRFDGTDGDLDNAGFWPTDVSRAAVGGYRLGYDHDEHGRPRRGEMAIVIAADTYEHGECYRGPDLAAVNVANLLGWAAEAASLRAKVAELEQQIAQLHEANAALRNAGRTVTVEETETQYIRLRRR
jgi:hypothetical protein